MALTEAGRRRLAKKDAGTLSNRWRAVAVQRRNFEVYRDSLSAFDKDDQEHEGEMRDFVAVAKGMQLGRLLYRSTQSPVL